MTVITGTRLNVRKQTTAAGMRQSNDSGHTP